MNSTARVVLDSLAPSGARLTTLEVCLPRFVLPQFLAHRAFSRNAASSRAIPTAKLLEQVRDDPFVPEEWGSNQRGMQAGPALGAGSREHAKVLWLRARDAALEQAAALRECGVHKQLANRLLEPFMWATVLVSATEWGNFFKLRCHADAQPELQQVARLLERAKEESTPQPVALGEWHLPYIEAHEWLLLPPWVQKQCSVARCARVSALGHDGTRDVKKDRELYERLLRGSDFGHWSPFEHVATPTPPPGPDPREGNFRGWMQFRKSFPQEGAFADRPAPGGGA